MWILLLIAVAYADVVSVVTAFRHGARAPIDKNSWDRGIWPDGYGELMPSGMRQQYLNGIEMHYRYVAQNQVISQAYNSNEIYIRSTDYNRTIMSVQSQMFGIYPTGPQIDQNSQEIAVPPLKVSNLAGQMIQLGNNAMPNGFQPLPIHVVSAPHDNMLAGYTVLACPRIAEIMAEQQDSEDYLRTIGIYSRGLQQQVYQVFGVNASYEVAGYMCDTLTADKFQGFA